METKEIDLDALKRRGFSKQRQESYFLMRTRTTGGNYSADQLAVLIEISTKFGREIIHPTTRQGLEIPFIRHEDIERVERIVLNAGIALGTSGPRLRTTTVCPGNNWCKRGVVDTFGLFRRIEDESVDFPGLPAEEEAGGQDALVCRLV